jgi:hypothetical protein
MDRNEIAIAQPGTPEPMADGGDDEFFDVWGGRAGGFLCEAFARVISRCAGEPDP